MGGCATKPKVLSPEKSDLPAVPESPEEWKEKEKEKEIEESAEKKIDGESEEDETLVQGCGADSAKEIVDDDKAAGEEALRDHRGNIKRRSLSHLFKENEEGNDSSKSEKTPSDLVVVKAKSLEHEKARELEKLDYKVPKEEAENLMIDKAEKTLAPEVIDAPPERAIIADVAEERSSEKVGESAKIITSGENVENHEKESGEQNAKEIAKEKKNADVKESSVEEIGKV